MNSSQRPPQRPPSGTPDPSAKSTKEPSADHATSNDQPRSAASAKQSGSSTGPSTGSAPGAAQKLVADDTEGRFGRYMIIAVWLLMLGLLYLWANRHFELMENPNQVPVSHHQGGRSVIELQINRQGHYVTNGTINDAPVTFLLDTGATSVSVPSRLAKRLQLRPGSPIQLSTANGVTTGYFVSLASVAIGELRRHNVQAHINPGLPDGQVLLGMSFLRHFRLTHHGDTLTIETAQPGLQ